jgi:predicted ATPase
MTFESLKIASCLGHEVDIALLGTIMSDFGIDFSTEPISISLERMESRCYIVLADDCKVFQFAHDRILQAAYSLVPETVLQKIHLKIGRAVFKAYENSPDYKYKHILFLAIDQLNRGRDVLETDMEREELSQLNLLAAQEMIVFSAFNHAKSNLLIALDLLGEGCWEKYYSLTLSINNLLASVLSSNGSMQECLDLADSIMEKCVCPEDRYHSQIIRLESLTCFNRLEECINSSMRMLSELQLPRIPSNPGLTSILPAIMGVKKLLKPLSHEDILSLPLCKDGRIQHVMKICKQNVSELLLTVSMIPNFSQTCNATV